MTLFYPTTVASYFSTARVTFTPLLSSAHFHTVHYIAAVFSSLWVTYSSPANRRRITWEPKPFSQQVAATAHSALLIEYLGWQNISRGLWPPLSLHLKPCDSLLMKYVVVIIHASMTIEEIAFIYNYKLLPARSNVSWIYLFLQTLYKFQAVPPPIIRST